MGLVIKQGTEMSREVVKRTRRNSIILFILHWVLILSLSIASNINKLHSPIEDFWQLYCHNWPGRISDLLFGGGFLIVSFIIVLFPKRTTQVVMYAEDNDENYHIPYWKLLLLGVLLAWRGLDMLMLDFKHWLTYCS